MGCHRVYRAVGKQAINSGVRSTFLCVCVCGSGGTVRIQQGRPLQLSEVFKGRAGRGIPGGRSRPGVGGGELEEGE